MGGRGSLFDGFRDKALRMSQDRAAVLAERATIAEKKALELESVVEVQQEIYNSLPEGVKKTERARSLRVAKP